MSGNDYANYPTKWSSVSNILAFALLATTRLLDIGV